MSFFKRTPLGALFLIGLSTISMQLVAILPGGCRVGFSQYANAVVCFSKPNCPYCKIIKPRFDQVAQQFKNIDIQFITKNVSHNPQYYKNRFRFFTVPTVIYFDQDGKEMLRHDSHNGKISVAQMQQNVRRIFNV